MSAHSGAFVSDNPDFQVRFRWQPNSIAIWDNRVSAISPSPPASPSLSITIRVIPLFPHTHVFFFPSIPSICLIYRTRRPAMFRPPSFHAYYTHVHLPSALPLLPSISPSPSSHIAHFSSPSPYYARHATPSASARDGCTTRTHHRSRSLTSPRISPRSSVADSPRLTPAHPATPLFPSFVLSSLRPLPSCFLLPALPHCLTD